MKANTLFVITFSDDLRTAVDSNVYLIALFPRSDSMLIVRSKYLIAYNTKMFQLLDLHSRLREPGFESCAAVLKPWARFFTLHCSSSLSCINEYLAIDSGGYVYEQPSRINCSIWLDASQRSR